METPIPGVFVVKVPASKTRPAQLFLEINPLKKDGTPMKRKGLFVGNRKTLLKFTETLVDDKTFQIMQNIEKANPKFSDTSIYKKLELEMD